MKIEKFNRHNVKEVNAKLKEVLKAFSKETGLNVEVGNVTFGPADFTSSITVSVASENGIKKVGETVGLLANMDYNRASGKNLFGRDKSIIGSTVKFPNNFNGEAVIVSEYSTRKPKNKWSVTTKAGKTYIMPTSVLLMAKVVDIKDAAEIMI